MQFAIGFAMSFAKIFGVLAYYFLQSVAFYPAWKFPPFQKSRQRNIYPLK
jgi:hypothetical protein